jgi:hypothetical protein
LEKKYIGETHLHRAISKYDMDIGEKGGTMKPPEIGTPLAEPSIGIDLSSTPSSRVKSQSIFETMQDD